MNRLICSHMDFNVRVLLSVNFDYIIGHIVHDQTQFDSNMWYNKYRHWTVSKVQREMKCMRINIFATWASHLCYFGCNLDCTRDIWLISMRTVDFLWPIESLRVHLANKSNELASISCIVKVWKLFQFKCWRSERIRCPKNPFEVHWAICVHCARRQCAFGVKISRPLRWLMYELYLHIRHVAGFSWRFLFDM